MSEEDLMDFKLNTHTLVELPASVEAVLLTELSRSSSFPSKGFSDVASMAY